MKKIVFSTLLIAALFISLSSFASPDFGNRRGYGGHANFGNYHGGFGYRGGFAYHGGYGYAHPEVIVNAPAPIIYGSAYPPAYNAYPSYYNRPYFPHPYWHRHFCHRW